MPVNPEFMINKSGKACPLYDVDKGRVGTLYDRESFVIYGGEDWITIVFLNSSGKLTFATLDPVRHPDLFNNAAHCTEYPYGHEVMPNGKTYAIFKMRQRKNIYKRDGSYWGAVAANMFVATNTDKVGETHQDWKLISYVKRSTDGAWIQVDAEGAGYGFVDTGLSSASTYNTIPFYGSW